MRRSPVPPPGRMTIAAHLVFTGYAHWLSNDPRGSGSNEIRKEELGDLGNIHPERKRIQPPRDELKKFHREAEAALEHEVIWFGDSHRATIGDALGRAAHTHGYTIWAGAVCSNHAHVVARNHRHRSELIWNNLAISAAQALRDAGLIPSTHPVWSHRIYKVFLYTPQNVIGRIDYVNENPEKEGLARQDWAFVSPYPR